MSTPIYPPLEVVVTKTLYAIDNQILSDRLVNIEAMTQANTAAITAVQEAPLQMSGVVTTSNPLAYVAQSGGWNASVFSPIPVTSVSGTFGDTGSIAGFGLSYIPAAGFHDQNGFAYAILGVYGNTEMKQGGNQVNTGTYNTTDIFTITANGVNVEYYKNGVKFFTWSVEPTGPMYPDIRMYTTGTSIKNFTYS